jgi:hypothetical protein
MRIENCPSARSTKFDKKIAAYLAGEISKG